MGTRYKVLWIYSLTTTFIVRMRKHRLQMNSAAPSLSPNVYGSNMKMELKKPAEEIRNVSEVTLIVAAPISYLTSLVCKSQQSLWNIYLTKLALVLCKEG